MLKTLVGTFIVFVGFFSQTTAINQTVTDVCTSNRPKQIFCNSDDPCDSSGLILCFGDDAGAIYSCPPESPYCIENNDGAYCSNKIDSSCPGSGATSTFTCTSAGYFPNVRDCNAFYVCGSNSAENGLEASQDTCPEGYAFDANSATYCSLKNGFNCVKLKCPDVQKTTNVQLTYGFNKQYYAVCIAGGDVENPLIFTCPTGSEPNLSTFPVKCNYRCYRQGNFPNSMSNVKYFQCYWSQLRLVSIEKTCNPGFTFNTPTSRCEPTIRSNEAVLDENVGFQFDF